MKVNELPTQEYLVECFKYNPETGLLTWNERPLYHFKTNKIAKWWNSRYPNKNVGNYRKDGYKRTSIEYNEYLLHRLIWKLYYGEDPSEFIDHINGIRDDNRICNLREANYVENGRNQNKLFKHNTSGYTGVVFDKSKDRWLARIQILGETINIGSFKTMEEAVEARKERAKQEFGEFYNDFND